MARTLARTLLLVTCAALALLLPACAAATRPATERPRADAPPYPVVLAGSEERAASALANWKTVVGEQAAAIAPAPELQPVTATLKSLPATLSTPPSLPTVIITDDKQQSEEETRESLRRFISTAAPLLGVNPQQLSLVDVSDAPSGSLVVGGAKTARYQQNPFQYPLRNGFGVVQITFTTDGRVVALSSTAIPDTERLSRALAAVRPTLAADKAVASLSNRAVTFTDRGGNQQTRTVAQSETVTARELVVFPVRRADAATLELHVAWEVGVGGTDAPLLVYLDALTGEQLAAIQ